MSTAAIPALLPASARAELEAQLPDWLHPQWWETGEELVALAPEAVIGWFDMFDKAAPLEAIRRARSLQWLNTFFAGVDWLPLDDLAVRGVRLTNGSGLNANSVAEFALMAMLAFARNHAAIVRAADRRAWIDPSTMLAPGATRELAGSRVLILGFGEIGQAIGRMLAGFRAEVVPVRRSGGAGALGPGEWRARLGEFDWVVMALPATPETRRMVGAAELAAMQPAAVLVNVGRAETLDQAALLAALEAGRLGGAILDLTEPEPLPPDHPLWAAPNCHITMHLAGLPTPASRAAAARRFLANCAAFRLGRALEAEVDLAAGY